MEILIIINIVLKIIGVLILLAIFVKINHLIFLTNSNQKQVMTQLSDFQAVATQIDEATKNISAYVQGSGMSAADQATALQTIKTAADNLSAVIPASTLPPITGTLNIPVNGTEQLANATGGGSWSSSDTAIATVDSVGNVTGVAAGTAVITYTVGSLTTTATVTVA